MCHNYSDKMRCKLSIKGEEAECDQRLKSDIGNEMWCPGADSNHRHEDFQSSALPTELPGLINNYL